MKGLRIYREEKGTRKYMYGRVHRMKQIVNRCITEQGRRKWDAEGRKEGTYRMNGER